MSRFQDDPDDYGDLAAQHVSLRRVLALFAPYRARIAGVVALMIVASAVGLAGPFLLRAIIDVALPLHDMTLLVSLVVGMIAVAMIAAVVGAWQVVLTSRIGQAVLHDLRVRLYSHLQSLSLRFFTGTRTGEVQSRIAGDIAGLQSLVTETASDLGRALSSVIMTAHRHRHSRLAPGDVRAADRAGHRSDQQPRGPGAGSLDLSAAGSRRGLVRRCSGNAFGLGHHPGPHHGPRPSSGRTLRPDFRRLGKAGSQVAHGGRVAMVIDRVRLGRVAGTDAAGGAVC